MIKKVAVVGLGFIGRTHVMNILKNEDLKLVAVVDKNIDNIESELHRETGNFLSGKLSFSDIENVNKYSSFDLCLENEELDAVHVCVHTDLHYEFTKKALLRGLNVLVEKPFVLNIKEGEELIRIAEEKGLLLMVAHVVRFMPPYQKLKRWVDEGIFGKLHFLSLFRFSGVPKWGQWKEKQEKYGSSGGALFDLVIHDIDFACFVIGEKPHITNKSYLPGSLSRHDYISAVWSSNNDVTVKIEGGNLFHSEFPFLAGFMAKFEKTSLTYSTSKPDTILIADDDKVFELPAGDVEDGYFNEIRYFYDCLETESEPLLCSPASALDTIRICYDHI